MSDKWQVTNRKWGWQGILATWCLPLITLLLLFPCLSQAAPLKIVTSFSILADMVHQVAKENAVVASLVGPDSDAHAFEPSPSDARAIANADVVVVNGLGFEGWLDRLSKSAAFKGHLIVASDGIMPLMLVNIPDPHAWQSVPNAKVYVLNIMNGLMKADPAHADEYEKNATDYLRDLGQLDFWVRAQIKRIPTENRAAITSHDALHYFADTYHLLFIAPLGLSTAGDISAGDMAKLVDQIRAQHVHAVFLENMTDPRLVNQLAKDGNVAVGGTLYSDALSAPDGPASTYIAMFRHNVTTITEAMLKK